MDVPFQPVHVPVFCEWGTLEWAAPWATGPGTARLESDRDGAVQFRGTDS